MSLSTAPVEDNFFLVVAYWHQAIIQIDAISGKAHAIDTISSLSIGCAIAVEYDPVQQYVYFSDGCEHVINRIKLDGSDAQVWIGSKEGMF